MLKKIFEFLKPALVPFFVLLVLLLCFKNYVASISRTSEIVSERITNLQKVHEEEMKKIIDANTQERLEHEKNIKQMQADFDSSLKRYEESLKILEEKKKQDKAKILSQYKDNPPGLSSELSKATGIKIYGQ